MVPILILVGLFLIYETATKGGISLAAGVTTQPTETLQQAGVRTGFGPTSVGGGGGSNLGLIESGVGAGLQGAQMGLQAAGSAVASAVPFIGAAIAPIFSLLAAHSARVKGAQTENQALNSIFPAMQQDIQSVFAALKSGQISGSQAETALLMIQENYWSAVAPFEHGPGQAGGPQSCVTNNPPKYLAGGGNDYGLQYYSSPCDNSCTVSCCAGCNTAQNWIANAITAVRGGPKGGQVFFRKQIGSHYGWTGVAQWTITY